LLLPNADASIAASSQTTAHVLDALKDCPTASYVVVEQRGVSSADYADGRAAPVLTQYMAGKHKQVRSAFALPDVLGQVAPGVQVWTQGRPAGHGRAERRNVVTKQQSAGGWYVEVFHPG
jgi:hypothetical protein